MPKFGKWNPKMAEALGRALGDRAERRLTEPKLKTDVSQGEVVASEALTKQGPNSDFVKGYVAGIEQADKADYLAKKYGGGEQYRTGDRNAREEFSDALSDEASDQRLHDDFKVGFEEAAERHGYKKWRDESRNQKLDDGLNGEIHNLEREGAVDDIRAQMIEDLRNKMDLSDFFDKWK